MMEAALLGTATTVRTAVEEGVEEEEGKEEEEVAEVVMATHLVVV